MRRIGTLCAGLLLVLSGCLPYSCRPRESRELMPSDSLSRRIAADVAADSLVLEWSWTGDLAYPRTVRFAENDDSIFVSDVERSSVFVLDTRGDLLAELRTLDVPYIAGFAGDTLAIFSPESLALELHTSAGPADTIAVEDELRSETSLVYAAYDGRIFYKRVGPETQGVVALVGPDGRFERQRELSGPHWRHAGLLRTWGDSLVSLSGFRPVLDVIPPHAGVDTLALRGFDSPMLSRSRAFLLGDAHEAPLLTTSAVAVQDYIFVLNMRPGWLLVDVFDRDGMLRHRLTDGGQTYESSFFPQDIDVRRRPDGSYVIAVAVSQPRPEIRLYAWRQ